MEVTHSCNRCGYTSITNLNVLTNVAQERKRICTYLSKYPMGIGRGTLNEDQIYLLLMAVLDV